MKTREEFTASVYRKAELAAMEAKRIKVKKKRFYQTVGTLAACFLLFVGTMSAFKPGLFNSPIGSSEKSGANLSDTYSLEEDYQTSKGKVPAESEMMPYSVTMNGADGGAAIENTSDAVTIDEVVGGTEETLRTTFVDEKEVKEVKVWIDNLKESQLMTEAEIREAEKDQSVNYYIVNYYETSEEEGKNNRELNTLYVKGTVELPEIGGKDEN